LPVSQQRIRDWLVVNFGNRTVTQWVHDLIERELPKDDWKLPRRLGPDGSAEAEGLNITAPS
jgi:hypothetical protein